MGSKLPVLIANGPPEARAALTGVNARQGSRSGLLGQGGMLSVPTAVCCPSPAPSLQPRAPTAVLCSPGKPALMAAMRLHLLLFLATTVVFFQAKVVFSILQAQADQFISLQIGLMWLGKLSCCFPYLLSSSSASCGTGLAAWGCSVTYLCAL